MNQSLFGFSIQMVQLSNGRFYSQKNGPNPTRKGMANQLTDLFLNCHSKIAPLCSVFKWSKQDGGHKWSYIRMAGSRGRFLVFRGS
jgi:hypothetical protein